MKNKNNPKSKKSRRQSQALARWRGRLKFAESFSKSTRKIGWIEFTKNQIAILEAKRAIRASGIPNINEYVAKNCPTIEQYFDEINSFEQKE